MAVARRVMSSSKPSRPRARPVVRKHVGKRNRSEADDEGEIEEQNQKRVNSRSMPVKTQKRKMVAAKTQKKTKGAAKSQRKTKVVSKPQKRKADKVVQRQVKKVRGAGPVKAQKKVTHASHPKEKGTIFVFGDGDCGQLGLGEDVTEKLRPFPLDLEGEDVLQVVCGGMHTVALTARGNVYSWGVNDEGALGRPTNDKIWNESPEGKEYSARGDPYVPGEVLLPKGLRVVQLSAGDSHTCALIDDGSIWSWGTFRDASGVMGFSVNTKLQLTPAQVYQPGHANPPALRIASGADHVCAVTEDGSLLSWGSGQQGQLGRVGPRMSDRIKLATFLTPTACPIRRPRGAHASTVVDVACGTYSTFSKLSDGSVYVCGLNNYGQLGLPDQDIVYSFTLVKTDKEQVISHVYPGQHHTLFLNEKDSLLSCGRPTYGRLGQKAADVSSDTPSPDIHAVDGLDDVKVVGGAGGLAVSGCFDDQGGVYLWGFGTSNQLAKGDDDDDEVIPRKVAQTKRFQPRKMLQLEFGGQHAALLCVVEN